MNHAPSYDKILLALHMKEQDMLPLLKQIERDTQRICTRDASWGFIPKSDEEIRLVFNRAGLKRVYAPNLVMQLLNDGFFPQSYTLASKPDTYTKKEKHAVNREERLNIREGQPKLDSKGQSLRKQCLEILFERDETWFNVGGGYDVRIFLEKHVWRRGRVYEVSEPRNKVSAIVELVMPFEHNKKEGKFMRLFFSKSDRFEAFPVTRATIF